MFHIGTDTYGYAWYALEAYENAQTFGGPTNWFTDFLCDVPIFKQSKRHTGSNAMPLVGEYVKNLNYSVFNGSLQIGTRSYNWFIATSNFQDGTSVVTDKHMLKIASDGEVLEIRDCSVPSTSTTSTTTNPSTPTTTVTYATQACPGAWAYSAGQTFPSNFKVELGGGVGWVEITFQTYQIPDRLIVKYLGDLVYDTGYIGSPSYQSDLDNDLSLRGEPQATISGSSSSNNSRTIRWFKPQSYNYLDLEVYAPLGGTAWALDVSCPVGPTTTTSSTTSTSSSTTSPVPTTSTSSTSSTTSSSSSTTTQSTLPPTTTTSTIDTDGDGIPDHLDPDDDNDGCYDEYDKYPLNAAFNSDAFFEVFAASDQNMIVGSPLSIINTEVFSQSLTNVELRQSYHHVVNLGNDFPTQEVIFNLGQTYFGTYQALASSKYSDQRAYYYYNRRPQFDVCNNNYCSPPPGSNICIVPNYNDLDFNGGQNSFPQQNVSPYFAIINSSGGAVDDIIIVRWSDAMVVAQYVGPYLSVQPKLYTLT